MWFLSVQEGQKTVKPEDASGWERKTREGKSKFDSWTLQRRKQFQQIKRLLLLLLLFSLFFFFFVVEQYYIPISSKVDTPQVPSCNMEVMKFLPKPNLGGQEFGTGFPPVNPTMKQPFVVEKTYRFFSFLLRQTAASVLGNATIFKFQSFQQPLSKKTNLHPHPVNKVPARWAPASSYNCSYDPYGETHLYFQPFIVATHVPPCIFRSAQTSPGFPHAKHQPFEANNEDDPRNHSPKD